MGRFLWLDLETTGLDPYSSKILEVAAIVTTADLQELDTFETVVAYDVETLQMTRWPWKQHTESGLLDDVALHEDKEDYDIRSVDSKLAEFIREYSVVTSRSDKLRLAGSSVHFDRSFMRLHLPQSLKLLHYRQFDVSSLRPLAGWTGIGLPTQTKAHRAMADIENSLALARHFKERLASR